ncbi:hypothetical protein JNB91_29520 [Rhizobium wenxiniae]|uniref:tetratricopeptide repeat protein n=1 Tax=Rhizobium wenxiniae TaxID=1737357 RepID=UPI001C6ECD93|nr:hypothetical protein [Rhizobium wenxiniae]MBW9091913.1 hypothetical protein [Rhizobium wenxiniae]
MEGSRTEVELDVIPEQQAREELERLLADSRFKVAERNRHFLRYITDARYQNNAHAIKSYSIAVDVFGRPESFDSQNDPIVRIEANRLRSGLDQFYEAYGEPGGLRIDIPKGRYVPRFTHIPLTEMGSDHRGQIEENAGFGRSPVGAAPARRLRRWVLTAVAAASAAAAIATVVAQPAASDITQPIVRKPTVTLTVADESLRPIHDRLLVALSRFDTVRIIEERQATSSGGEGAYMVRLKAVDSSDERGLWWQITDGRSSEVLKTGFELASPREAVGAAVPAIARQVAATRGAIGLAEARRDAANGNPCILRAEMTMDEGRFTELGSVRPCLQATLAADPADPDAASTLSRFLVVSRVNPLDTDSVGKALDLATGALIVSPGSDRAMTALMFAQFAGGQTDAAIHTGQQAVAGNPDNLELAAKVGLFMVYAGRWEEGTTVASRAAAAPAPPRAAVLTLALDAYRRGDYSTSLAMSERINCGDILVRALRIASSARIDPARGEERYVAIKHREPEFEKDLLESLGARRMNRDLVRLVADGVRRAGAAISEEQVAGL